MFKSLSLVAAAALIQVASATDRGLAWATNNDFAPTIGSKPKITWYHHWQDGAVSQMPSKVEYVPMFWGAKKWDKWNSRKTEMNKKWPKHLLGFNEPDIASQGDMNPDYAVQVWMQEIHPYATKGVVVGSPAIAWDLNWMDSFLKALSKKGGYVNFICIHWYGSWKDIAGFKKFVQSAHDRFKKDIWITELGITSSSNPSAQQTKEFMMNAFEWLDSLGYVKRASWFGCFQSNQPPDSYATAKNALFKTSNALSDMGFWYGYSDHPDRRRALSIEGSSSPARRHARIAARHTRRDEEEETQEPGEDCDEICQLREGSIKEWEGIKAAAKREEEDDDDQTPGVDCDDLCQLREGSVKSWEDSQAGVGGSA